MIGKERERDTHTRAMKRSQKEVDKKEEDSNQKKKTKKEEEHAAVKKFTTRKQQHGDLDFKEVDPWAYNQSFDLCDTSPLVRAIMTFFCNTCVGQEVFVVSDDGETGLELSPEFKEMLTLHVLPMALRSVRWVLVMGMVPVSFERNARGLIVPVVPDHESVVVQCAKPKDGFKTVYRVLDAEDDDAKAGGSGGGGGDRHFLQQRHNQPVDSMFANTGSGSGGGHGNNNDGEPLFVVSDFSVPPPTHKGRLQSPFASLLRVHLRMKSLERERAEVMSVLRDPPIVTQMKEDSRYDEEKGLSFEVVGGTNVMYNAQAATAEHAKKYARENPEALLNMRDKLGDHGEMNSFVEEALRNSAEMDASNRAKCITLPTNHVLVKQHLPAMSSDHSAMLQREEQQLCALFGLPLSVVMGHAKTSARSGSSATNVANNSSDVCIAALAVNRMRQDLETLLTRLLKVACYMNHYNKSKVPVSAEEDDADEVPVKSEALDTHDLFPAGAQCRLATATKVMDDEAAGEGDGGSGKKADQAQPESVLDMLTGRR